MREIIGFVSLVVGGTCIGLSVAESRFRLAPRLGFAIGGAGFIATGAYLLS